MRAHTSHHSHIPIRQKICECFYVGISKVLMAIIKMRLLMCHFNWTLVIEVKVFHYESDTHTYM